MNTTAAFLLRPALMAGVLFPFALSACSALQDAPPPPPPGPVESFIVSAEPGQSATLDDPLFGANVRVTTDNAFISARGEECRRATVMAQSKEAEVVVICRPEDGNWTLAPRVWGDDRI